MMLFKQIFTKEFTARKVPSGQRNAPCDGHFYDAFEFMETYRQAAKHSILVEAISSANGLDVGEANTLYVQA